MRFWSVLVLAKAKEVKDLELKFKVINLLMDKYAKGFEYELHLLLQRAYAKYQNLDTIVMNEIKENAVKGAALMFKKRAAHSPPLK